MSFIRSRADDDPVSKSKWDQLANSVDKLDQFCGLTVGMELENKEEFNNQFEELEAINVDRLMLQNLRSAMRLHQKKGTNRFVRFPACAVACAE